MSPDLTREANTFVEGFPRDDFRSNRTMEEPFEARLARAQANSAGRRLTAYEIGALVDGKDTAPADVSAIAQHMDDAIRATKLPDSNPKTQHGVLKPQLGLIPGAAMVEISEAMRLGKEKYTEANWRDQPVSASTYFHAALRHLYQWWDGEDRDQGDPLAPHHLGAVGSNAAILLDAMHCGTLLDDRPTKGATSKALKERTRA